MNIGVVGGGINGIMSAWALAKRGCAVNLFERNNLIGATSAASTKLLHGGLRYLEHGQLRLVREALRERSWWIEMAPHLAHPLNILLPIYDFSSRPRWLLRAGLSLYEFLAGRHSLGATRWMDAQETLRCLPDLKSRGLKGAYSFFDGQMNDQALGLWAADQARASGVEIHEQLPVTRVFADGSLMSEDGGIHRFDFVVNAAGPWAKKLLTDSALRSRHDLDLVRGSHLILDRPLSHGVMLEDPESPRIFFVLPYLGKTLLGTTEQRQNLEEPIRCSPMEKDMLIALYNTFFASPVSTGQLVSTFSGLRPLLKSHTDPSRATREYALEKQDRLLTVFGGKWTTARALGESVADALL